MRALTRTIVEADADRGRFLVELTTGTRAGLRQLSTARHQSTDQQRARLAEQRADLVAADASRGRAASQAGRTRATGRHHLAQTIHLELTSLHRERQTTTRQQRTRLAGERTALAEAEAGRRREGARYAQALTQTAARRRSTVQGWLGQLRQGTVESQREWGRMLGTLARRRRHGAVAPAARPTQEAQAVPQPELSPTPQAPAGEAGMTSLSERVASFLAANPDGLLLGELADRAGKPAIAIAGTLKRLTDAGLVEKRGLRFMTRIP
jgi:hypothetical protein